MNQSITPPTKQVHFADDATVEHEAGYTFDNDDIEVMFYTNAEVNVILQECKQQEGLPLFWAPLRISRTYLLWDEVDKEQRYQRKTLSKAQAAKYDLPGELARISHKITQYQQTVALKEATKVAKEVKDMTTSTRSSSSSSNIHKSLSSSTTNGLQSFSRNSIAAALA
mmetsp:Transcript_45737/g.110845  ORF Transcript_45737/g.110845 Transcript_45737/m.110845 type:complete len:168 (+) Transcript_45737:137-640(+)